MLNFLGTLLGSHFGTFGGRNAIAANNRFDTDYVRYFLPDVSPSFPSNAVRILTMPTPEGETSIFAVDGAVRDRFP